MHLRLSLLLFLVYAPFGAMWPLFALRLKRLGFSPGEIALACSTQALGTLLGPVLAGQAADRWLAAERCLAACAFTGAAVLWLLADCTSTGAVFAASLVFWLVMGPTMTLSNTISFTHLRVPEREFGRVRLWGTVGWVLQGWLVGLALDQPAWLGPLLMTLRPGSPRADIADAFRFGAVLAVLLGCYALTMPHTPPRPDARDRFAPLAALRLLRRFDFALYFVCNLLLCLTIPFSTQNTSLLLDHLGVSDRWKGPALTIAQSTEIVTLGLLPWMLARWGLRRVMLAGAAAWAGALSVMALGWPPALVVGALSLNGLFITCYVVAGYVYVNGRAGADIRASAQALVSFTTGAGLLMGYALSGAVGQASGGAFRPTFGVAAALALVAVTVFAAGFRPTHGRAAA